VKPIGFNSNIFGCFYIFLKIINKEKDLAKKVGNISASFHGCPTQKMHVMGVTGTNGKTSITNYIQQILHEMNKSCGVVGTLGIQYNGIMKAVVNTTPDAITLQSAFLDMVNNHVEYVAMEVSSHALEQGRVDAVEFNTAIISNITHDHLDYHKTFDNYVNAKLKLFLSPTLKRAVVNKDDPLFEKIVATIKPDVDLISYSIKDSRADYFLQVVESKPNGYIVSIRNKNEQCQALIPLIGKFNLSNILAAIASVSNSDISLSDIVSVCAKVKPVSGRMEMVENTKGVVAVVDYAHTPDALEKVLKELTFSKTNNLYVVFGCGGDRDASKRPVMASIAEKYADYVIVTSDNPRNESLENINEEICQGFSGSAFEVIPTRDEAIEKACAMLDRGDTVLVAGKGHEKYQIIGTEYFLFDDVEVLKRALATEVCNG